MLATRIRIALTTSLLTLVVAVPAVAEPLKVVTTFTVIADMARNVAGNRADIVSVTKPGAEIHGYEPTPSDLVRLEGADLVLWNGLNLEAWFARFLRTLDNVPNATVSDGVDPIEIGGGAYQGRPNPHAWMSLENAMIYVDNIEAALTKLDPDGAATYHANAIAYKEKLRAAIEPMKAEIATLPENDRWLVTSEGAFSYLARDLGLHELYLWPINADAQGTPQQVRHVVDEMRAIHIPTIFSESTVSDRPARQIAYETGARYGGVLYVDSLSAPDGPVPTYLDLLKVTTDTIVKGLKGD